ncbi:PREDICTED: uncharacterized protein LOC106298069 [Brassica oleracea var. oleracea]|uniref:uncharacterized protein LOC106298069 n=1 Tax=Brassica oleracea var. oleracea TaxID=109376 RepID=UPI0006A73B4A|nr:PREDICTED: uncharacterized protein LOC106298069 [Brassica oleracea var. oleracea]
MSSSSSDEVDEAIEEMVDQVVDNYIDSIVEVQANKPKRRVYIDRDREQGHNQLWNNYFKENPTYPPEMFRRCFRMNKPLFIRIVEHISKEVPYFQQRRNAHGRNRLSALQKCTAAIHMLAYGQSGDTYDEYLRLGDSTSRLCLANFTDAIIQLFGDEYLRKPTAEDLQRLLDVGEVRGFPGMIGSIDCTLNDINIHDRSPVFDDILHGRAPKVKFKVNNHTYLENERHGYAQIDTSEFESGESSRSSRVTKRESIHVGDMLGMRREVRDPEKHARLKADLMENIWQKFDD